MIPIRGLTGSHAYAQGRTAGANAAGDDRTYDPVWVPWGWSRRLHDRRLLARRDAGRRHGRALRARQGRRRLARPYFPGATRTHVKLLAEPGTLKLIGGQIHGGEGVKERCDFLAFAAKRGATLEDFAWMENIYSPPIGALFEPIAIAAQNGLAELRKQAAAQAPASSPSAVPA
jgi:NADH oxidase (H2O2-forming)